MSLERLTLLKRFVDSEYGTTWQKANLHVHAQGQDPEEIVDEAIKAGISIIAITDHNTFRFVKPVQEAAENRSDRKLVVLPGIEITLEEGAHILAVFDADFDETQQTHFLGTLKIPVEGSIHTPVKDRTCSQVLTDIMDSKGITVVPHAYSDDIGFLDKARKVSTKMSWLESGNIGLIQINEDRVRYIDYLENTWENRYILSSTPGGKVASTDYCLSPIPSGEAQKPKEIEQGSVWLKVGSPTVRGLRQVTCEPRTCISEEKPKGKKNCMILGLAVKGGFFDGLEIGFSSDLTCIFGENHSGKSAIFDFISFAFGRDISILATKRKEELALLLRRLNAILQPDGEVDLFVKYNGNIYSIHRKFVPEYDRTNEVIAIQDSPEMLKFDATGDNLVPIDGTDESIFVPEIYSQSHVGVLRTSVQSQLSLIDELAGLSELCKKREELVTKLESNAEELAGNYDESEGLIGSVGKLSELRKELKQYTKHLEKTDNELWDNTKGIIEDLSGELKTLTDYDVSDLKSELLLSEVEYDKDKIALDALLNSLNEPIQSYNKSINSAIGQITDALKTLKEPLASIFEKWKEELEAHTKKVSKALREQGFESPEQLLNKIETIKSEIRDIEGNKQPRLKYLEKEIKSKTESRENLLNEHKACCKEIRETRLLKINELNDIVGPDIRIALDVSDSEAFLETVKGVCSEITSQQMKLQRREEQLSRLVENVSSLQLLEAINNGGKFKKADKTFSTLCETCGITENTQNVLCAIKGSIKSLHKLQIFEVEPTPRISVRREGTSVFADLRTELSPGEQSAAILTLALMARDVPLLIDQPEDELGYSYIVNKIVPKILDSKKERQVVLITHNANIPVLADADFLAKMRNDPIESQSKCSIELSGTFADEKVCNKVLELEGGERAFQIRQYRYAIPRRFDIE